MKRTEAFGSNYLCQDDLPQPHTATVRTVGKEMMNEDNGGQREKPVVYFHNGTKPLVLNMINWDTLENAYGPDSENWIDKPVELYVDPHVMFGSRRVGGIRIRIPKGDNSPINFEKAQALCREVGSSREELIEHLRKNGRSGYNAARDSQLVREFITSRNKETVPPDDVPF